MSYFTRLMVVSLLLLVSACATISRTTPPPTEPVVLGAVTRVQIDPPATDLAPTYPVIEIAQLDRPSLDHSARAHIVLSTAEIQCLTDVIYFESKSEPEIGQIGVAYVVLNRMGHPQYPKTACGVAYDRKHGCQFDWACKGRVSAARHARLYEASRKVAMDVMEGRVSNPVGDSTQFRQARLRAPRGMVRTVTLHGHSFYAAL